MPVLVQLSIVAASAAFVALAIYAIRAIRSIDRATEDVVRAAKSISETLADARPAFVEARATIERFGAIAPPLQRVAERFEHLGLRVARVSETVVDEIETPLRNVAAVVRGVSAGTRHWIDRMRHGRSNHNNSRGGTYDG